MKSLKKKTEHLKRESYAIYLASKDPRVPWHAKVVIALTIAYAISPIDLIPDFIPVLGQLDDLIIVPAGISLATKMIPEEVLEQCRKKAVHELAPGKKNWGIALAIVLLWAIALGLLLRFAAGLKAF